MSRIAHRCDPEGECLCIYDPECNPDAQTYVLARVRDVGALIEDLRQWAKLAPLDRWPDFTALQEKVEELAAALRTEQAP